MKQTRNIARQCFASILSAIVATLVLEPVALAGVDPSWTPTGNLNTPRSGHTATLLPNGKVLVAAGDNSSGAISNAELYDPSTGTWSVTGNLVTARGGHTATLLPNGKVLVVGGYNYEGGGDLNSAELYDPSTGTWSVTGSLNTGRGGHTATLLPNGKVLVVGGYNYNNYPYAGLLNSAELYDPATGTWAVANGLNEARSKHTATLLPNGKVLVAGGQTGIFPGGNCPCFDDVTTSAELYDPSTGTWSLTGNLRTQHELHTATLLGNDKLLVAGGTEGRWTDIGEYVPSGSVELYDPATGTWSVTASLTTARYSHTATLLPNGKVLVAAGYYTGTAELDDPTTGTWSSTASLDSPRLDHTATLLPGGKVLLVGSSAELYDSPVTLWAAVLPSSRSVQVGSPATAFATIINAGQETATGCTISPVTSTPATLTYQTTDPATNQITGSQNTPLDISPGAAQSFIFALTPTAPMDPTDIQLSFDCANTDPAPIISGLNTLLFSASASPTPDIMALVATLSGDGIVNIPGTNGTGVFAVATVNVGAGDNLTVSADTGGAILPVNIFICQTDPQSGACLAPPDSSVTTTILSNETPTFGVFVAATGDISFFPETHRIFLRFKDSGNVAHGLTSVAVRTQ